jgi:hypothetical protein
LLARHAIGTPQRIRLRNRTKRAASAAASIFLIGGLASVSAPAFDIEKSSPASILSTSGHRAGSTDGSAVEQGRPGGAISSAGANPVQHGALAGCIIGLNC